jgi:hypothetical protein
VRGLLAPLAAKNSWTLAEAAGNKTPDGMQRLLNRAAWDADGTRDDVRGYVARHLGDESGVVAAARQAQQATRSSTDAHVPFPCCGLAAARQPRRTPGDAGFSRGGHAGSRDHEERGPG